MRLRHTLVDDRGEFQQRIRAVLYHHGLPARSDLQLLRAAGREWLAGLEVPAVAREQITVALAVIDALDVQIAPLTTELQAYARRQTGCKALIDTHYGIGPLTAVAVLAELGTASGSRPPGKPSATPAWISPCTPPTRDALPGICPVRARRACVGR